VLQNTQPEFMVDIIGNHFFSSSYLLKNTGVIDQEKESEKLIRSILDEYTDAGFAFCRIYPAFLTSDSANHTLLITIEEGKRIKIADYIFDIQGRTNQGPVRRIAQFKTDTYFSSSTVDNTRENLFKTGVFTSIKDNIVLQNDLYYVLFTMTEAPSDNLIAYAAFNEDDYDFSITYDTKNLLGTLRRLVFQYEYENLFALDFTDPVLLYPLSLNGNFSLWTYDSVRLVKFYGKVCAPLSKHFDISLVSGLESFSYFGGDTLAQQHADNFVGIGLVAKHDARSWSSKQQVYFEYLLRDHDRQRIQYDGEFQICDFHVRPHYYYALTDSFEYFDYFRIGGGKDLRGYFEEEFYAKKAGWFNIEYKKFFIFPLFDIGWIEEEIIYSYGFGLTLVSRILDSELIFAWPEKSNWLDGKIHIKIEKCF
jgi:outer membrane protein assembly factor BamA